MDVIEFMEELKALMKKHKVNKIVPIETIGESKIELIKGKDALEINGFKFDGLFDNDKLEIELIKAEAKYNRS